MRHAMSCALLLLPPVHTQIKIKIKHKRDERYKLYTYFENEGEEATEYRTKTPR
jgi:hypothetical protein